MRTGNLLLMILAFVIAAAGCKKGDTGSAGPQGPQGNIGATGADGTKIFSGQGAPAATLGRNGDFYVDLSTSNMYGPKADAGWGTPYSLKGVNGSNGTNGTNGTNGANGNPGSKIYSGTGAPINSTGVAGDYFMSTDTYLFYGPKTDAGWGIPVNLKGPKGDKGEPGETGAIATPWKKFNLYSRSPERHALYYNLPLSEFGVNSPETLSEKGIILVYANNPLVSLPFSFPRTIGGITTRIAVSSYISYIGGALSTIVLIDNSRPDMYNMGFNEDMHSEEEREYRVIYVPIRQITASANSKNFKAYNQTYTQQQLQAMSYTQVTQLFNIKN